MKKGKCKPNRKQEKSKTKNKPNQGKKPQKNNQKVRRGIRSIFECYYVEEQTWKPDKEKESPLVENINDSFHYTSLDKNSADNPLSQRAKSTKKALQKVIKKNLHHNYFPFDLETKSRKSKRYSSEKNSLLKNRVQKKTKNLSEGKTKILSQTFLEKVNKSQSQEMKKNLRRQRICDKTPENRKKEKNFKVQNTLKRKREFIEEKSHNIKKIISSRDVSKSSKQLLTKISSTNSPSSTFLSTIFNRKTQIKGLYINFMSQICGQLTLSRETFQLASYYFLKNIDYFLKQPFRIQFLALASLVLAAKVDDALISKPLFRELIQKDDKSRNVSHNKNESITEHEHSKQNFLRKLNLMKKKQTHRSFAHLSKIKSIMLENEVDTPNRSQLIQIEKNILFNLEYRLCPKTLAYSIDYLTFLWDDYVIRSMNRKQIFRFLFRTDQERKKMSYLFQMADLYFLESFLQLNKNLFILTSIYILVRIQLENKNSEMSIGLQTIRESLSESTNILYIDSVGLNAIFMRFLEEINERMESISQFCCKIPRYLEEKLFEVFQNPLQSTMSFDESLAIHHHNPKLYQFFTNSA